MKVEERGGGQYGGSSLPGPPLCPGKGCHEHRIQQDPQKFITKKEGESVCETIWENAGKVPGQNR